MISYIWLPLWLIYAAVLAAAQFAVPRLVFPRLKTMAPLQPGPLRDAVETAVGDAGIKIADVIVEKGIAEKKAYFCGTGKSKSIVVSEELAAADVPAEEVLGVISHEAGHCLHRDVEKTLALRLAGSLAFLWLANRLIVAAGGGAARLAAAAALLVLTFFLLRAGENAVSRRQEWRADEYARLSGHGAGLAAVLKSDLTSDSIPSKIVYLLRWTHPLTQDRIAHLRQK